MAHVINDECISCGASASVCPVECISEGSVHYEVDGSACEESCPTGAIFQE